MFTVKSRVNLVNFFNKCRITWSYYLIYIEIIVIFSTTKNYNIEFLARNQFRNGIKTN